jgi:signal transduction histidine kinase
MFRDEVAARGVHLQLEEDKSMRALQIDLVRGDSSRFVQVIVNLLSNAIKFTGSAPHPIIRVRIGATEVPEGTDAGWTTVMDHQDLLPMCRSPNSRSGLSQLRLYIAVADSGLGMTEQEQSCLFQRFAQANPRTYGEFGGSGLGLVSDISRWITLCSRIRSMYLECSSSFREVKSTCKVSKALDLYSSFISLSSDRRQV